MAMMFTTRLRWPAAEWLASPSFGPRIGDITLTKPTRSDPARATVQVVFDEAALSVLRDLPYHHDGHVTEDSDGLSLWFGGRAFPVLPFRDRRAPRAPVSRLNHGPDDCSCLPTLLDYPGAL